MFRRFFRNILYKNWSFKLWKSVFDAQNFNVNLKSEIIYPRIDGYDKKDLKTQVFLALLSFGSLILSIIIAKTNAQIIMDTNITYLFVRYTTTIFVILYKLKKQEMMILITTVVVKIDNHFCLPRVIT